MENMSDVKVYLKLSDEAQKLLGESGSSLQSILRQKNIDAEINYEMIPLQPKSETRGRDLIPFLGDVAAVLSIVIELLRIYNASERKTQIVVQVPEMIIEIEVRDIGELEKILKEVCINSEKHVFISVVVTLPSDTDSCQGNDKV